jgi:hypothetical protein
MESLVEIILSHALAMGIGGGLLLMDRWFLRRYRPYGAARMWNRVTLALALSNLFLPVPWAYGAHVWVTRRGSKIGRALLAVLAATLASALWAFGFYAALQLVNFFNQ